MSADKCISELHNESGDSQLRFQCRGQIYTSWQLLLDNCRSLRVRVGNTRETSLTSSGSCIVKPLGLSVRHVQRGLMGTLCFIIAREGSMTRDDDCSLRTIAFWQRTYICLRRQDDPGTHWRSFLYSQALLRVEYTREISSISSGLCIVEPLGLSVRYIQRGLMGTLCYIIARRCSMTRDQDLDYLTAAGR